METNKKGACAIPHLSLQRRFASSLFLVIRSGLSVYKSIKPSSNLSISNSSKVNSTCLTIYLVKLKYLALLIEFQSRKSTVRWHSKLSFMS